MNLTRWKLLAAGFGVSVCGIAALAEPACRSVGHQANRQDAPVAEAKLKGSTEPKAKPVEVPTPVVELPVPLSTPITPTPATIPPIPDLKPIVGVTTPAEVPSVLQTLPPAQPIQPVPTVPPIPVFTGPVVTLDQFRLLATPPTPIPEPIAVPTLLPAPVPQSRPIPLDAPLTSNPFPVPEVLTPVASVAPSTEKKLKVTLQMDENNPRLEVRDGEEVVLKVISNKVDVASPTQKGERWSTLKASGQVKFMTPGGDGFCDELQVVPGTGEVIATGHVKFTYNWGKVETSATAEKMNFRLGAQAPTK